MKQVIVIGTFKGREDWSTECVRSCLNKKYEVVTIFNNKFELSHIKEAYKRGYDEFLYLHDTCVIKDKRIFDIVFEEQKGRSVALSDYPSIFGMYLGKYTKEGLKLSKIPKANSKLQAVQYEKSWTVKYAGNTPTVVLNPPLRDGNNFVTIRGKMYMKLENDFIIKYKGTWNRSMI